MKRLTGLAIASLLLLTGCSSNQPAQEETAAPAPTEEVASATPSSTAQQGSDLDIAIEACREEYARLHPAYDIEEASDLNSTEDSFGIFVSGESTAPGYDVKSVLCVATVKDGVATIEDML